MGSLEERRSLVEQVFKQHDVYHKGYLDAEQLQDIHCDMRLGGISIPQVELISFSHICIYPFFSLSRVATAQGKTGKTGNLAVNFSRQGKHREFSKFIFLHRENCGNTGKILKI